MASALTRRRAIAILAATAGLPLTAWGKFSSSAVTWRGIALGAPATLVINHTDRREAERLIKLASAEVERLERIFSLYLSDSQLVELNQVGALVAPPAELVSLLKLCGDVWNTTGGAFDPTVQPLWILYRDHFADQRNAEGPGARILEQTLFRVGFDKLRLGRDLIAFGERGMGLTLNGVAQGYITDRVVELLKANGVTSTLVDMGEVRSIGRKEDGLPWRAGLAASEGLGRPDEVIDISDRAVATSSASGYCFDRGGHFGHILDPRKGTCAAMYERVSVIAGTAAIADALSTAFSLMNFDEIKRVIDGSQGITADIVSPSAGPVRLGA